jgi:hypothetical protein
VATGIQSRDLSAASGGEPRPEDRPHNVIHPGSELLFDVISTAYERTSLIVTTNLPFDSWTEVLGSERLTGATLDRLTHRCRIIETKGESYRLQDAKPRTNRSAKSVTSPCGRIHSFKLTSHNRTAALFGHHALLFWIMIHIPSRWASVTCPHREHHAAGVRSPEGVHQRSAARASLTSG